MLINLKCPEMGMSQVCVCICIKAAMNEGEFQLTRPQRKKKNVGKSPAYDLASIWGNKKSSHWESVLRVNVLQGSFGLEQGCIRLICWYSLEAGVISRCRCRDQPEPAEAFGKTGTAFRLVARVWRDNTGPENRAWFNTRIKGSEPFSIELFVWINLCMAKRVKGRSGGLKWCVRSLLSVT